MYHSVPYEPLSQVKDEEIGSWLDSNPDDGHGEFYNSNPYNPYDMTVRAVSYTHLTLPTTPYV